tara:strand:- start:15173 stop:16891 length:1719 start_codon:yes stop_codon:yes gene_type:complete
MIVFERIRWKNFLSTGNQFTEINFLETPSTLIIGNNGAGKSTMLDALCFGLFNKPFRKVTKSQLVNSINERESRVEIEFSIGSVEYKVIRGMKPGLFELYRNDNLIDQDAANRDYQKYLEQSILKLNFKSFTQVVILGSSTFVPFMQLSAPHRREVIEDILDIQVFSHMNMLLKDRVKDNNEALKDCEHELEMAKQAITSQQKTLDKLTEFTDKQKLELQIQIDNNEDRMSQIHNEVDVLQSEIDSGKNIDKDLKDIQASYNSTLKIMTRIDTKNKKIEKDIKFFTNNTACPTCAQTISPEHRDEKVEVFSSKGKELSEASIQLTEQLKAIEERTKGIKEKQSILTETQFEIRRLYNEETRLLKQNSNNRRILEIENDNQDIKKEDSLLKELTTNFDDKEQACASVNKDAQDYKLVATLLKDGGIKSKIISKYIPIINQRINKYLSSMDTYINFTLDDQFREIIKSRHRDKFSYSSFSEGEKQKIDLSLLFTWRHIAKIKNSITTNLLILDEVFDSSLDTSATEELLKILKELQDTTNMFIISHKGDILLDKFDRTIKFDKSSEFSKCINNV